MFSQLNYGWVPKSQHNYFISWITDRFLNLSRDVFPSRIQTTGAPKILFLSIKITFPQRNLPQQQVDKLSLRNLLCDRHSFRWHLKPILVSNLQMASVSPFPTSQGWYHFRRMQISGHSSVQSSSTFRSRKTDQPIYILRFNKSSRSSMVLICLQDHPCKISCLA